MSYTSPLSPLRVCIVVLLAGSRRAGSRRRSSLRRDRLALRPRTRVRIPTCRSRRCRVVAQRLAGRGRVAAVHVRGEEVLVGHAGFLPTEGLRRADGRIAGAGTGARDLFDVAGPLRDKRPVSDDSEMGNLDSPCLQRRHLVRAWPALRPSASRRRGERRPSWPSRQRSSRPSRRSRRAAIGDSGRPPVACPAG
jgi:hypothetical protein